MESINDIYVDNGTIRAEIARLKIKKSVIAKELNIAPPALVRRLNGEVPFSAIELALISQITNRNIDFYLKQRKE